MTPTARPTRATTPPATPATPAWRAGREAQAVSVMPGAATTPTAGPARGRCTCSFRGLHALGPEQRRRPHRARVGVRCEICVELRTGDEHVEDGLRPDRHGATGDGHLAAHHLNPL